MSNVPNNLAELISICKGPNRNQRLKSISKDAIADLLAASASLGAAGGGDLEKKINALTTTMQELSMAMDRMTGTMEKMEKIERDLSDVLRVNAELKEQLKQQSDIIKEHQRFMEKLDQKERANNLIIVGVAEGDEHADEGRAKQILASLGETAPDHANDVRLVKRLGNQASDKARPILVTLGTTDARNRLVELARTTTKAELRGIRIKKDTHPAARAEWKRLHGVKEREEARSENVGRAVALDWKKRQVTIDGNVVDSWNALF